MIFGAMKPTFLDSPTLRKRHTRGFHLRLVETHPHHWGQSFVELAGNHASGPDRLKAEYAKHYILESYLAAHKIARKLKKAAPAVRWLQISMLFLAGFILSYGASLIFLAPSH